MLAVRVKGINVKRQDDGYSCGLCAMSTIYRFYGFSPSRMSLKERLGTEHALPYFSFREKIEKSLPRKLIDSELGLGTWPMDIFAVLYADGFEKKWMAGEYGAYQRALYKHLKSGHPALILSHDINHWMVVSGMDDKGVDIVDSGGGYIDDSKYARSRYRVSHEQFGKKVSGVILIKRKGKSRVREMAKSDFMREYADGAVFGVMCSLKAAQSKVTKKIERLCKMLRA